MIYRKIRHVRLINFRNLIDDDTTILDTFYTLSSEDVLLYVSEVIPSENNPNFQLVSLPKLGTESTLSVSLFANSLNEKIGWTELLKYTIDLNADLVQIPSSLLDESNESFLKTNSIILQLSNDQFYTIKKCVAKPISPDSIATTPQVKKKSYTFDSIRSTNNIYKSIKELSSIKLKLSNQIDQNINPQNKADATSAEDLPTLDKFVNKQRLINDTLSSQIIRRKVAINETKQFISDHSSIDYTQNQIEFINSQFEPIHESETTSIYPETVKQMKKFAEVISDVFIIESVDNSIKFKILDIEFPSTVKQLLDLCYYEENNAAETVIRVNATLAYISQMMSVLATITKTNLKYPIHWKEDKCHIADRSTSSTFPLYYNPVLNEKVAVSKTSNCIRNHIIKNPTFEFGLNLLNRNLMLLIHHTNELFRRFSQSKCIDNRYVDLQSSIPIDCFDNFLWNLQYLVLFLTA
ncbi:hypothetical protein CLIB1423_01S07866 [[Candida] railenensis]|uniref:Uncharacterized protein n=1 Tax=[Candida] railenensis TaxID=45579 RepID=A0A9P0VWE2_9ASCO|nr:hypothetical protein CLIB1423_01S07866 [[Candida] railenensis]